MSTIATAKDGGRSIKELISHVSASRLTAWQQCRLKFFFRYVLGLKKTKSPALHLGSTVHLVLKHWNKARWKNEQPSLKQLHDLYSASWIEGQIDDTVDWEGDSEEDQKKTGFKLLETYFRETPITPDEKPEAVEVNVEADLSTHGLPKLIGIIDLVRHGGRIVDFKTSGKAPDPEQVAHLTDTQTTAYAVLYRESAGKTETGIELHHLVKTKNPRLSVIELPPATEERIARLFRVMDSYLKGLQKEDWIPSPGFTCAGCEFFNECRAWH